MVHGYANAGLGKRLMACLYELVLLIAIWLLCTAIFMALAGNADTFFKRSLLQACLWLATGFYFVTCWHRSGQTLAAQTWRIMLVNAHDRPPSIPTACYRYLLASVFVPLGGLGLVWALVDKDRQFLHDRCLRTRLVKVW